MVLRNRPYSLRKSRRILKSVYSWYKKHGNILNASTLTALEMDLEHLDQAILNGDREKANQLARKMEAFEKTHIKKSFFQYAWELTVALGFALIIAVFVRQMWFEPYEIPTGSMRPTFKEQDHLTVSKLAFGINMPLETSHLYFDPNLVQRTSVLIFSGEGMPVIDQKTTYFGIVPYTKRYIKRMIGKPGDSVYFYGGKIYAVDKEGNPLTEFLNSPWMHQLEHIPFMTFEGLASMPRQNELLFNQFQLPIGRLTMSVTGDLVGEIFNGKKWIKDQPQAQLQPHDAIETYSDFWGMRNYAMSRLLTKQQLEQDPASAVADLEEGLLYLELRHTPSLNYPRLHRETGGASVAITPFTTVIPLQQHHLDAIFENLYTARFVVKDGRARSYSVDRLNFTANSPHFPGVPDGTYEFYFGKAYEILWGGIAKELPADHPLYNRSVENIQKLYNIGIEMDDAFSPQGKKQRYFPRRYAYFREGDLYLLGAPILKKADPTLMAFVEREQKREQSSSSSRAYISFKDYGPPLKSDGSYDVDFIRTFGVNVTRDHYLVLGDNHAMSSDSRIFGFVPQNNIQGAPSLIIWPPGERWGFPEQKPYPIINLPRLVVWSIALFIACIWYAVHRWSMRRPIFKKVYTTQPN